MWYFKKNFVYVGSFCALGLIVAWFSCSTGSVPRFMTAKELSTRINLTELTPLEIKRFERVVNEEVSPCGDDVTLAEALSNPEHCPLAPMAGKFVTIKIMEDYSVEEIARAYVARYAAIKGLEIPLDGSPRIGASKPVVTLVVFSDFECPFCAKTAGDIKDLLRRYPDKIATVFKHFPLASHPVAMNASRAAFAAARQDKFWELHDTMFSALGSPMDQARIEIMAQGLGIEIEKFKEDIASSAATAAIAADRKLGEKLGVGGTPTLFVNGRMLEGGASQLKERLKEEFLRSSR